MSKARILFGGPWCCKDWTASDDRVRGGASQSYLDCGKHTARFHGTLDIETLGGAGFASQRTTGDDREWDLSKYAGIQLDIKKGDKKRYTFILKDQVLAKDPETGREQSTISYEVDFVLPPESEPEDGNNRTVFVPWDAFNATYRGKLKKDAPPLKKESIKRMSIMMRSFFGTQKGDFCLDIKSISAISEAPKPGDGSIICPMSTDTAGLESGGTLRRNDPRYREFRMNLWIIDFHIWWYRSATTYAAIALTAFCLLAIWYAAGYCGT